MRAPIAWYGGKHRLADEIIARMPPHHTYVEPFGGAANVLLNKEPSPVEVYNDLDQGLSNFFEVLSDPALFEEFYRRVAVLPCSRVIYEKWRDAWNDAPSDVERAVRWFFIARQSFSGIFGRSWRTNIATSNNGMAKQCSSWLSTLGLLPEIHARLQCVQIEWQDFRTILDRYDTPETLFYLDPPYILSARNGGDRYDLELTDADHEDLIALALSRAGHVMISGYRHPLYDQLEAAGWHRYDFNIDCSAMGRTRGTGYQGEGAASGPRHRRIDSLWVKPWAVEKLPLFSELEVCDDRQIRSLGS